MSALKSGRKRLPYPFTLMGGLLCLYGLSCWVGAASLQAVVLTGKASDQAELFPMPPTVKAQVRFWEKIFSHYPSHTVVIHDAFLPDYLIDIVDFQDWERKKKQAKPLGPKERQKITAAYIQRYELALKRFKRLGKGALKFGAIEKRVYSVYRRSRPALARLLQGRVSLRAQGGLADEFIAAAQRAQEYLPFMEATFRRAGVPVAITRLAFVESMFNLKARSKVGASGLWQFMPQTARAYMRLNRLVDERNSPYKATRAAAKLLLANYKSLGSWPLAITAYNHGRAGMERAVKQVGSSQIERVIQDYRSKSFGFASRNFYSEFLAAKRVYEGLQLKNFIAQNGASTPLASITLSEPLSVHQLLRLTPLTKESLRYFNPCLRKSVFGPYRYHKLPRSYELFVPQRIVKTVLASLNRGGKKQYARSR